VDHHKRQIAKTDEKLNEDRISLRERQARLDALQLDIAAREESIDKHRQALNKAKTNKEYASILAAMNTEKADNAKLETQLLQLMDACQSLKDEAARIDEGRALLLKDLNRAEEALQSYDAESQERRDGLQAERDACADRVPPSALATFNRVAEHHDGEAVVPVIRLHPKRDEYACSGCNMKLTLEVVNSLQSRDEIQVCKVCGRILHIETPATQRSGA
jgi:predicted  nucleic acid-binding Zn-ribbon protein